MDKSEISSTDDKNITQNPDTDDEKATQTTDAAGGNDVKGLDYLTRLNYSVIDRSDRSDEDKRALLLAAYSFRCLFDDEELKRLSPVLVRYGVSFFAEEEPPKGTEHVYPVKGEHGKIVYKYDVGSPFFRVMARQGKLPKKFVALPEKPTLFELVRSLVTLSSATDELRAMWLVYFPYVFMIGAPLEHDVYDEIKRVVMTEPVFETALESKYADNICCTTAELVSEDPFIADWYRPFIEWKCEKDEKGVSRETAKYQRALARGEFAYAIVGTEKLLDSFPDDEHILLLNISARSSLVPTLGLEQRVKVVAENYRVIEEALKRPFSHPEMLYYYRGLAFIAMNDPDAARADFDECLRLDPKFEPAQFVLRGMEAAMRASEKK